MPIKKIFTFPCIPSLVFALLLLHPFDIYAQVYHIPSSGSSSITTCSGTFYDSGGASSDYGNSENGTYTFCTGGSEKMVLTFTCFDVEYHSSCGYDQLSIYDGSSTSDPLIGVYCNSNIPYEIKASGSCLSVVFSSDGSVVDGGWEANISCSSTVSPSVGGGSSVCSDNLFNDPSFEACFSPDEDFPNSSITTSNNADTKDNYGEWNFEDGSNANGVVWIEDATRAADGEQFIYIKTYGSPSTYNRCVGNRINRVSAGNFDCSGEEYANGYRYVVSLDWVPFNQSVPEGGASAGVAVPRFEYDFPDYATLYDNLGSEISFDTSATGTTTGYAQAVGWDDVASSWQTATGVTSALSADDPERMWVSLAADATAGLLMDNVQFRLLSFSDAREEEISCGTTTSEITFSLNPNANIGGVPGILYDVSVPSGFSISPAQGTYGQNTTFTLSQTNGGVFSDGSPTFVQVTVSDEINTHNSILTTINNPYPCTSFPVELLDFQAELEGRMTQLSWRTASESETDYFGIERSIDKVLFQSVGQLAAAGTSTEIRTYDFLDDLSGLTRIGSFYYRLRMVDLDGSFSYSSVAEVNVQGQAFDILVDIHPIPVDEMMTIRYQTMPHVHTELRVFTAFGQVLHKETLTRSEGQQSIPTKDWPNGVYYVAVSNETNKHTYKVIVAH